MAKKLDISGQRFGRLVALDLRIDGKTSKWRCLCDCGSESLVQCGSLVHGNTKSCGCLKRDVTIARNTTHGQSVRGNRTTEHRTWLAIKERCYNPNADKYRYYGGRGITVCDRWRGSFEDFFADMGPKPTRRHTIDRKDSNGNYDPLNCEWVTQAEQTRNTRRNIRITKDGVTLVASEWDRRLGFKEGTIKGRIARGWPMERLLEPLSTQGRRVRVAA